MGFIDDLRKMIEKRKLQRTLNGIAAIIFSANTLNSAATTENLVLIVANVLIATVCIAIYFSSKVIDKINHPGKDET